MKDLFSKFATLDLKGLFIGGLVLGALYFFLYYDNGATLIKDALDLDAQITEEQAKEVETQKNTKKLQTEKENLKNMETTLANLQGAVSQSLQMTDIIKWVDSKTVGSAVSLKGKEPKPLVKNDFLEELPIHLTLDGTFSDITLYLFNLMSSKEILGKISSVTLNKSSNYQPTGVKLSADVILSGYRVLPAPTPDPKKPAPPSPNSPPEVKN